MSTLSNGGLRDTSQVWSCWRGCLCLLCTLQHAHGWPGEQLCPARQPAHTHDAACWCSSTVQPDMSRCVTKSRSAFPKPEPVRVLPQSPGPRMSPQGPVPGHCGSGSPVGAALAACPVCSMHTGLLSSPRCHHLLQVPSGVVFPPASVHSPPLPLCLEQERQSGNVSQIQYLRPPRQYPVTPS